MQVARPLTSIVESVHAARVAFHMLHRRVYRKELPLQCTEETSELTLPPSDDTDENSRQSVRRMRSLKRLRPSRIMIKNLTKRRLRSKRLQRGREKRGPRGPRMGPGNKQRHRRRQRRGRRRSQRAQRKQRRERRRSQRARRRMQQIKDRARMRAAVGRLDKGGRKGRRSIGNAARGLMA